MKALCLMPFMLAVLLLPPTLAIAAPSEVSPVTASARCANDAAAIGSAHVRLILACLDGRAADGFVDNFAAIRPALRARMPQACDCVVLD